MDRRAFIGTLTGGLLAAPLAVKAQQMTKIPRIGVLAPMSGTGPGLGAFDRGLRDLGWVDGQNVVIERRSAEGRFERFPGLATELVHLQVDVIIAAGGPASLKAAREATTTIPIVMVASSRDPVAAGFVKSFARPGGTNAASELSAPVADRLFFAGEATDHEFPGTVAGALASGERAARQALELLNGASTGPASAKR